MSARDVPEDGELQVGSVRLPVGRRIHSNGGQGEAVAWSTTDPVPDAGRVWAALSDVHAHSGLVPFLLSGIGGGTERPWDSQEFGDPEEYQDEDFARSIAEDVAPFLRRQFPGLAQAEDHRLDAGQFDRVLSGLGPARVGLVPADRPAEFSVLAQRPPRTHESAQHLAASATNSAAPACTTSPASRRAW